MEEGKLAISLSERKYLRAIENSRREGEWATTALVR